MDSAIDAIDKAGALLVFPVANKKEPASLWSSFYPRSQMRWEWDEFSDPRISKLWHLRADLSDCSDVVYAKWLGGRATFFSRPVFTALLAALNTTSGLQMPLSEDASSVFDQLLEDSPQSPRTLREATGLTTKYYAAAFDRALRDLWARLLIVGFGEIDDGAFPSLAIGATKLLYEELWEDASIMTAEQGERFVIETLGPENLFVKQMHRIKKKLALK